MSNSIKQTIEAFFSSLVDLLWGLPLVILLVSSGCFFLFYSRLRPYRHLGEGVRLLIRPPARSDPGELSHFQALATALSGTLGMGNVSGVAIAIAVGGPGPIIDTLIVCTCTALVILISELWRNSDTGGVTLTAQAFNLLFPIGGSILLAIITTVLSLSTVFTFWYYGSKCLGFLIGAKYQHHYIWFYIILVMLGAITSLSVVINIIDSMYALMAIPTLTGALLLAPKVNAAAKQYFARNGARESREASVSQAGITPD